MYKLFKRKNIITFIFVIIIIFLLFILYKQNVYETFDSTLIITNLDNKAGFYSMFFFLLNHYIYCKKNKTNFKIKSDKWLFNSNQGWSDYFEPTELVYNSNVSNNKITGHSDILGSYSIKEYKEVIPEIYKYNDKTKHEIHKAYKKFNLVKGNYDSIFIRRGDKLSSESILITEDKYISIVLKKNPNCEIIYLQTDDYNCYKKLKKYIEENELDIKIYTLCEEDSVGVVVHNFQKNNLKDATTKNESNKEYLSTIIDSLNKTKAVEDMDSKEKYNHTINMIIGIDLILNSNICITDYQSNVSRFIKLAHNNSKNVYDVNSEDTDINYEKIACPGNGF